ncbi:hypothetical protein TNCT6_37250 [Streptomyces sp. 6-11-2]|nr:hypothetical protein TNCT6_37250 [Streptomyces sp. 6-11-2]
MRVVVSAEFASMPSRQAAHTPTVNLTPGMWDMFHLIRFISQMKGLLVGVPGHMAHMPGAQAPLRSRDQTVIQVASVCVSERDRSPGRPSLCGLRVGRETFGASAMCHGL